MICGLERLLSTHAALVLALCVSDSDCIPLSSDGPSAEPGRGGERRRKDILCFCCSSSCEGQKLPGQGARQGVQGCILVFVASMTLCCAGSCPTAPHNTHRKPRCGGTATDTPTWLSSILITLLPTNTGPQQHHQKAEEQQQGQHLSSRCSTCRRRQGRRERTQHQHDSCSPKRQHLPGMGAAPEQAAQAAAAGVHPPVSTRGCCSWWWCLQAQQQQRRNGDSNDSNNQQQQQRHISSEFCSRW